MFRITLACVFVFGFTCPLFSQEKKGLELLIVANSKDDEEAIRDVRDYINNPMNKALLDKCQKEGLPPPVPGANEPKPYQILLAKGLTGPSARELAKQDINEAFQKFQNAKGEEAEKVALQELEKAIQLFKATSPTKRPEPVKRIVTYRWVELGPHVLQGLNLDKLNQNRATTVPADEFGSRLIWEGALFFSREGEDRKLSKEEQGKRKVEYFVLVRNREIDPETKKEIIPLGSKHITKVKVEKLGAIPALNLQLNKEGTQLLADLTGNNAPKYAEKSEKGVFTFDENSIRRILAIVVNGKVVSGLRFSNQLIVGRFMITGRFSQKEIGELVENLRPKE